MALLILVSSRPVAITVIDAKSATESSYTAPKIILVSSPVRSLTKSAASLASISETSPEMLMITSVALLIVVSRRGLATAILTASRALSSPVAEPIPIWATPLSCITVLTSAKSRLISPGLLIRSVIP